MSVDSRTDLWFSILLTAFGAVVVFESWRMPRLENLGVDPMSAPGLTPGLLGLVLTALGVSLLVRSVRALRVSDGAAAVGGEQGWGRFAITLALCLGFGAGLVGLLPFWLAAFLFVLVFVLVFTWTGEDIAKRVAIALVMAAGASVSVTLLFERVFLVRLP